MTDKDMDELYLVMRKLALGASLQDLPEEDIRVLDRSGCIWGAFENHSTRMELNDTGWWYIKMTRYVLEQYDGNTAS